MEDWILIDSKKAFYEALEARILSDKEGDKNFVGDFMYIDNSLAYVFVPLDFRPYLPASAVAHSNNPIKTMLKLMFGCQ